MDIRNVMASTFVAGALIGAPGAAVARGYVDIEIAPPAPRVEVLPAPRTGYVWAPGYWYWDGYRYQWRRGHWLRQRPGYAYVPPSWHRHGHRWRFDEGRWEHHRHR